MPTARSTGGTCNQEGCEETLPAASCCVPLAECALRVLVRARVRAVVVLLPALLWVCLLACLLLPAGVFVQLPRKLCAKNMVACGRLRVAR